jgi:hypothetical protein
MKGQKMDDDSDKKMWVRNVMRDVTVAWRNDASVILKSIATITMMLMDIVIPPDSWLSTHVELVLQNETMGFDTTTSKIINNKNSDASIFDMN